MHTFLLPALLLLLPFLPMKAPTNLIPSQNVAAIRNGNAEATADAIAAIVQAHNAESQTQASRIGSWQEVPYSAANFTVFDSSGIEGGGSWTVEAADQQAFRYLRVDDLLIVRFKFTLTSVVNVSVFSLAVRVPGGFLIHPSDIGVTPIRALDNNVVVFGVAVTYGHDIVGLKVPATHIGFQRDPSTPSWANSANQTSIEGTVILQIAPTSGN